MPPKGAFGKVGAAAGGGGAPCGGAMGPMGSRGTGLTPFYNRNALSGCPGVVRVCAGQRASPWAHGGPW